MPKQMKIVAEYDVQVADDLMPEQFVKLMADYLWLCRFTINVHKVDMLGIDTKVNVHIINLPEGSNVRVN